MDLAGLPDRVPVPGSAPVDRPRSGSSMVTTRSRGAQGEALAAAYLELLGCVVEARNARIAGVEVDLVVREGRTRALIEVKFRGRSDYGGAALAVDRAKRERLRRAASTLARDGELAVRIDVIAIELRDDGTVLRHYRNAVTEGS